MNDFDVAVVGLGAMGSACAAELADRDLSVLGLERFGAAHDRGSSHGDTRMIRLAYFEGPEYMPLLKRAYERWRELEKRTGTELLTETGGLMIGRPSSRVVKGSLDSARQNQLEHQLLTPIEVKERWPRFCLEDDEVALFEPRAGYVRPEAAVAAHLQLAGERGAELKFGESVTEWTVTLAGIELKTSSGAYSVSKVVLTPGAWAQDLFGDLSLPLIVERHVQFWFRPESSGDLEEMRSHPVFIWEDVSGVQAYGFPALANDSDIKAAMFRSGSAADPDHLVREVGPREAEPLVDFLASRIIGFSSEVSRARPCMYTTAIDENFVIGLHPYDDRVVICSACSGHGFKFSSAIGEVLADLVTLGKSQYRIESFSPLRFNDAEGP